MYIERQNSYGTFTELAMVFVYDNNAMNKIPLATKYTQ